jgi:hypothetical protein
MDMAYDPRDHLLSLWLTPSQRPKVTFGIESASPFGGNRQVKRSIAKKGSTAESGEREKLAVDESSHLAPAELVKHCHAILEAASSLLLNLEYLADDDATDRGAAVADARNSIERISQIVRSLQDVARAAAGSG